MEKTIADYSKETELYSKWRVLKTQQVGEFVKLALAPKAQNAPLPKMRTSNKTQTNSLYLMISIIVSAIVGIIVAISHAAYETVVVMGVSGLVTLILLISYISSYAKDKKAHKALLRSIRQDKRTLESFKPEQVKQQFAQLGQQADRIAIELGVKPSDLEQLRKKAAAGDTDDIAYYRRVVELIQQEHDLLCEAYSNGRPDPFIDCGLATSPEGAQQKKDDFYGYALYFSYVEGHMGYSGAQGIWYSDIDQVKLRENYKELKIVK